MTHPILDLQAALLSAWRNDAGLMAALDGGDVFDAPPKGRSAPYAVILRHDVLPRDTDGGPGHDHRLLVSCWSNSPSRRAALAIAEPLVAAALTAALDGDGLTMTHRQHDRTDTAIDPGTGWARATVALRFLTEPTPA